MRFLVSDVITRISQNYKKFKKRNLYQIEIDTDENWHFKKNARYIKLPIEITENGDYIY